MLTKWGKTLDAEHPLPEYPRPQMVRDSYVNLNGVWEFAVTKDAARPERYDDRIVVPFSPEAPLSGTSKRPGSADYLHYRRTFSVPEEFRTGRVLLHFGAVDQVAEVFINKIMVTKHQGGYWPFTVDITSVLTAGENVLEVTVRDDAGDPTFATGKQRLKSGGIWYTAQSGIWQTVWMESVPMVYIKSLRITPDYDRSAVEIALSASGEYGEASIIMSTEGGQALTSGIFRSGLCRLMIPEEEFHPWSPETPYLYRLSVQLDQDRVESYFALRKFSYVNYQGHRVFALNDKPLFHCGLLDQGYWPDGLLTPPADEAMVFDIQTARDCGFNMLRKHIKIEPLRWYYHCDRLGMIVWQDMVSGGGPYDPLWTSLLPLAGVTKLSDRDPRPYGRSRVLSRARYREELRETVELLYNCPCIALWTPFNEGWGQFETLDTAKKLRALDPTRYIDHASGWQDQGWEEIASRHIYFRPIRLKNDGRALCLTEFGGYILALEGHKWCEKPFGYKVCRTGEELERSYRALWEEQVLPAVREEGLTAAVYTQLTDVEQEMNGLVTYDREVVKIAPEKLREIHRAARFEE